MAEPALDDDRGDSRRVERKHRGAERPIYQPERIISPEDALAQATATIKAKDAEAANLRTRAEAAEKTAHAATTAQANTELARIADHEMAITNSLTAAETAEKSGAAQVKAAREAGDIDAEMAAMDIVAEAKIEKAKWRDAKVQFEARKPGLIDKAKKTAEAPPAQAQSDHAKTWIVEHPKYHTDPQYKQDVNDAENAAAARGLRPGSSESIAAINTTLTRLHGENHGREGQHQEQHVTRREQRDSSSFAAPPSRDMDAAFSANVDGVSLRLSRDQDGRERLSGTIPSAWREAAKWNGMDEIQYSIDQLKIMEERKNGGSPVVQHGEGAIYR